MPTQRIMKIASILDRPNEKPPQAMFAPSADLDADIERSGTLAVSK